MNVVVLIGLQAVLSTIAVILFCMSVYYFVTGIQEWRYRKQAKRQYTSFSQLPNIQASTPVHRPFSVYTPPTTLTQTHLWGTYPPPTTYHYKDPFLDF